MISRYLRTDGSAVTSEEAVRLWALEAHDALLDAAAHYGRTVSAERLAQLVQDRAGVRTTEPTTSWLSRVLTLVVHRCHATGEPPLTSLVLGTGGLVGVAYAEVQRVAGSPVLNELARERAAAEGRLECYRAYASDVPADARPIMPSEAVKASQKPARAPRAATRRAPQAPEKPSVPLTRICPSCFLETPIAGECQNCGA